MDLIEGHVYRGTLPRNRSSPRHYKVERLRDNRVVLYYGWFAWSNGKSNSATDVWTWSKRGPEEFDLAEFHADRDLGVSPDEGDRRSSFWWASR
jgi:hypothetical protein